MIITESSKKRFWSKVEKLGNESGCWIWVGATVRWGYGHFSPVTKKWMPAHRFSWLLHKGDLPEDLMVCHRCDTPACVNPHHLFLGDHLLNMKDCVEKGRNQKGERGSGAKLSNQDVYRIREMYSTRSMYQKDIAILFGVDQSSISHIVTGANWKGLK